LPMIRKQLRKELAQRKTDALFLMV
jgi:hypothetical protein